MVQAAPAIRVRKSPASFGDRPLDRHWFAGDPITTALVNGLHLLFPAGERFFMRAVRHYADGIDDPQLRRDVKAFCAQEGAHAGAHEQVFRVLAEQGYPVDRFLAAYERKAYGRQEQIAPRRLRLAVTAALEHYTAVLAREALDTD